MGPRIIVLSGPVNAGKSNLATELQSRFEIRRIKTQDIIVELTAAERERRALQQAGEKLDRTTAGAWVARAITQIIMANPPASADASPDSWVLIDAVRIPEQIAHIRQAFGPRVVHIHLTASREELVRRHGRPHELNKDSQPAMRELPSYEEVAADPTEAKVEQLADLADIVVDTQHSTKQDVVVRVAAQLGLFGRGYEKLVDVVVGGEYGSEGKGQISAYLAPDYDVLVRVGGPNAGHRVYQEPQPMTYHHLPSGTARNQNATIVLGPGAVLRVSELLPEIHAAHLTVDRLCIDPRAMIVSDEDVEAEQRLTAAIGSTGSGVGVATARKVLREIAERPVMRAEDIPELKPYRRDTLEVLDRAFSRGRRVFLEGTQGTGLSLHHGSYPYVTSRDTTVAGCLSEAGIPPGRVRRTIMVCRTYPIRVASPPGRGRTSGPMSKELEWQEIADRSGIPVSALLDAEKTSRTKKLRRIGEFDWDLIRRAASLNAPTDIALSFVDYISVENRKARRFERLTRATIDFISEVERVTFAPVSLIATRFDFRGVIDRRAW
jgi:adenylosuccinate synthase